MADAERLLATWTTDEAPVADADVSALAAVLDAGAASALVADPRGFARLMAAPWPIAAAVRDAAGQGVAMAASPIGEAVREAAGAVDVVEPVLAGLGVVDGWAPVGRAVRRALALPGVSVADAVLEAVVPPPTLAEALRASAGRAEVADDVMAALAAVRVAPAPAVEPAANRGWRWLTGVSGMSGLAVAAISLIWVPAWIGPDPLMMADVAAAIELAGPAPLPVMDAAHAGEVNVDEISTAGNAAVFVEVPSTDDAAMIIWVTEGGA